MDRSLGAEGTYGELEEEGARTAAQLARLLRDFEETILVERLTFPSGTATAKLIDREAEAIVAENYERSIALLREHKDCTQAEPPPLLSAARAHQP